MQEYSEQERKRYDKLQLIPREEWSAEDIDLVIRFESDKAASQAAYDKELEMLASDIEQVQAEYKRVADVAIKSVEQMCEDAKARLSFVENLQKELLNNV